MRIFGSSFFINKFIGNIKEEMSYEKLEVTKGLMEAYTAMYIPQEEVVEDIDQLNEAGNPGAAIAATQQRQRQAQAQGAKQALQQGKSLGVAGNFGFQSGTTVKMDSAATRSQGRTVVTASNPQNRGARGGTTQTRPNEINLGGQKMYAAQLGGKDVYVSARKPGATPAAPQKPGTPAPAAPQKPGTPAPAARPATPAPAATKTAPTAAPAGQTGDKAKDMATWAKANPKLAAAAAERDRTRGTSATTNPLMKDFKDRLPAPKAPSPTTASTAFKSSTPSLGSSSSSVQSAGSAAGAKAFPVKPVTSAQATAATTKPVAPEVKATNTAAAAPKPVTANPSAATKPASAPKRDEPLFEDSVDIFDVVIEYLVAEGYADTNQAALVIMANMSEEWREEILEAKYGTAAGRKALAKKIRKGENIGKKGPGTGFKAVEKAAEKGGAEDPTAVAAAAMYKTYGGKKG